MPSTSRQSLIIWQKIPSARSVIKQIFLYRFFWIINNNLILLIGIQTRISYDKLNLLLDSNEEKRMFQLQNVVPWGRSFQDYIEMFNLTSADLKLSILDCAGGPASFNAVMKQQGKTVISCDPIYQFTSEQIQQRIDQTYPIIIDGLYKNIDQFVWKKNPTPEALGADRLSAMNTFLEDFAAGKTEGRYRDVGFPQLPFADQTFDLAISSHLLFTYSEQFSWEFHWQSILDLCRVAKEVRIFPLVENFTSDQSRHLESILKELSTQGYETEIEKTVYEFQRGGNQLLKVRQRKPPL